MTEQRRDFLLPADDGIGDGGAVIVEWLVAAGDRLTVDRPVCTVNAAGVARTLLSPFAGTVEALGGEIGDRLDPRALVVRVATVDGEGETHPEPADRGGGERAPEPPRSGVEPGGRATDASPLARRLADEYGVDLSTVGGSGPGGLVTRADVHRHVFGAPHERPVPDGGDGAGPESNPDPAPTGTPQRLGVPTFTCAVEVESGQLDRAGQRLGGAGGAPVTRAALLARLVVPALADTAAIAVRMAGGWPVANGTGDLAVRSVGAAGTLFSTVVAAAHGSSLDEIDRALATAESRAVARPTDGPSPPVVVQDLGELGLDAVTSPLAPGASVVVTCGRSRSQVRLVDDRAVTVAVMTVVVTFDARAVAVDVGAAFVRRLVTYLEDPILAFADRGSVPPVMPARHPR